MPMRWRSLEMFLEPGSTSSPSMRTLPPWMGSRPLMQRRKVDLPQPEGPMTTMTSPGATSTLMSLRTTLSP